MKEIPGRGIENRQQSSLLTNFAAILPSMHDYIYVLNAEGIIVEFFQPSSSESLMRVDDVLQKNIAGTPLPFLTVIQF